MTTLTTPLTLRGHTVPNRIVFPPMVCFGWTGDDGIASPRHVAHYEARAKGGAGIVILEAHAVNKRGRLAQQQLGAWSDEHIAGMRSIADACHRHGALTLVQIHHAGLNTPQAVLSPALAPSDITDEKRCGRAMTVDEIHYTQRDFVAAARRVREAGFDGIELHGAHGYLLCQFMSPVTNHRTDDYGGTAERRMRFALEVIAMIRDATGPDFVIGYRMGANEPTLDDGIAIAKALEAAGVDIIHVSSGITQGEQPEPPAGFPGTWIAHMGTRIREHVRVPVIVVNGIREPAWARELVETDQADFVAVGRAMLVDPAWGAKAMQGGEILACIACSPCRWFFDPDKCPPLRKQRRAAAG